MTDLSPKPPAHHRWSRYLYAHPRLRLLLLIGIPVLWLVGLYGGSLIALLVQSFYRLNPFSGTLERVFSFDTWNQLFTDANVAVMVRTITMAAAVTVASVIIAFPLAYYMARYASKRMKAFLVLAVLVPLWSSYLVRVYSWKLILAADGIIDWFAQRFGAEALINALLAAPVIGGPSLSISLFGQWVVFIYIWLPFMILPIHAALERVPRSLLEASADLGAHPSTTFRRVTWPMAIPGVAAGSIFTFSLTLGDYIIPTIIGDSSPFIGLAIYTQQGVAGNLPLAAAFSFVPIAVMAIYLSAARKVGAFEAL
jgi:putative spermidine/putrescine transport system permease protein